MALYPLMFEPRFVDKIWGGRKFEHVLGKSIPAGQIGESWELYDFPPGVVEKSADWVSAKVANGPLAGKTLHELVQTRRAELCGHVALVDGQQFPILIKFLDAKEDLSVQVHPDEAYCQKHPEAHLKTEAWYVMQNEPDSRVLIGLREGVTKDAFAGAINDGTVEDLIRSIKVKPGDCYFLRSGTVHALGAGILVAEVQTPSDTTFRVYHFKRVHPSTGKRRQLHVVQAIETIDFSGKVAPKQERQHVATFHTAVTRLCSCEFFTMEKVRFSGGVESDIPYGEPMVWMMMEGEAEIRTANLAEPVMLKKGQTVLLPAEMEKPVIKTKTDCVWIETTFPTSR